jgi:hypothetical protein
MDADAIATAHRSRCKIKHQRACRNSEPQPWGPWHVFYKDVFVPQIDRSVFQWNFAPKWFRNGGREFTLTFSGVRINDSWNSIDGTFTVEQ